MHRFFLPPERCQASELTLSESDSHHASRVLRLAAGDEVEILDGAGRRMACRLTHCDKRTTTARVVSESRQAAPPRVILAPAVLKGRAMDWLVQKATELGVAGIEPLLTERTIPRMAAGEEEAWVAGWQITAVEASKQCGNAWLPTIAPPRRFGAFLSERVEAGTPLLAAMLRPDARRPREVLANLSIPSRTVMLVIGPEGDLTESEQDALMAAGALAITLGPLVLRAETAAIAGLAILQQELL